MHSRTSHSISSALTHYIKQGWEWEHSVLSMMTDSRHPSYSGLRSTRKCSCLCFFQVRFVASRCHCIRLGQGRSYTFVTLVLSGLIFNDAFALNVHLFLAAFWQVRTSHASSETSTRTITSHLLLSHLYFLTDYQRKS